MSQEPVDAQATTAAPQPESDPQFISELQRHLQSQQNLPLAILAGSVAAIVGAAAWAAVTVLTKYQIGWMAVGVGLLVGLAVRQFGRGITPSFGMLGAVLSLVGCALGNLLSICGFVSIQESVSYFEVVRSLSGPVIVELMKATFSPMDLLFYGIAVYEGYRFSFRQVTQADLQAFVVAKETGRA